MRGALLCSYILLATPAFAQPTAAMLTGMVRDSHGGVIAGATVTATLSGWAVSRSACTGSAGGYTLAVLPPGVYTVRVELAGFETFTHDNVRLYAGETARLDVRLDLAALSEKMVFVDGAPLLRTETAALGHIIDGNNIIALPLNGRSFITLAALAPASRSHPALRFPGSTAGARERTNTSSTESPYCNQSPGKSHFSRCWMRSKRSRSKAIVRRRSSAGSTVVW